jgi:hypothetical protein
MTALFYHEDTKGAKKAFPLKGSARLCVLCALVVPVVVFFAGCASVSPEEHAARRATARRIGEQAAVIAVQAAANYYLNQEGYRK